MMDLIHDARDDCNGVPKLEINPYLYDVENEEVEEMMCDCMYQNYLDDI